MKHPTFLAETLSAGLSLRNVGLICFASAAMGQATIPAAAQGKAASSALQVTNLSDAGAGSLRSALATANGVAGDDVISFAAGLQGTITLGGTHLLISSNVTIQGPTDRPIIINANRASRVLLMNSGQVKISNLTLTGGKIGGGGYINGPNDGGGIRQNEGQLTLENCTLSGNTVTDGFGGAMIRYGGSTILRQCTIANNVATGAPGTPGDGGGLDFEYGATTISNCTIAGNSAGGYGGGIFLNPTATATFDNTIIAGNTAGLGAPDIQGKAASAGHNLLGRQTNSEFTGAGDQVGTTAPLDPRFVLDGAGLPLLASNGGSTQTIALQADSPAIDAGDTILVADQRGVPRPFGAGDDIGALEASTLTPQAAPALVSLSGPTGGAATVSGSGVVSPLLSGISAADSFVSFTTTVRDSNGSSDLDEVYFILGSNSNELRLIYNARTNLLSVKGVAERIAPGDARVLATPSGALDCGATTVTRSGNDLTVVWRLKITTLSTLKQGLRLQAQDQTGARSPVLGFGTWTFTSASNQIPTLVKMNGPSGSAAVVSGTPPTVSPLLNGQSPTNTFVNFATTVRDGDGNADLDSVYFIVGTGNSEVRLTYSAATNRLSAPGGSSGSFAPGSANFLTTRGGVLDCAATRIARSGNDLIILWRLAVTTTAKQGLRLQAQDKAGSRSPALNFGSWTFTNGAGTPTAPATAPATASGGSS